MRRSKSWDKDGTRGHNKNETEKSVRSRVAIRLAAEDSTGRKITRKEGGGGRSRTMFLNWLLKNDDGNIAYGQLKMIEEDRTRKALTECRPPPRQLITPIWHCSLYHCRAMPQIHQNPLIKHTSTDNC